MRIVESVRTLGRWPEYDSAIEEAHRSDRWCVGLNSGIVVIAPHIVWGMTVAEDVALQVAYHQAYLLSKHPGSYLGYLKGNQFGVVKVVEAKARVDLILPKLFASYARASEAVKVWLEETKRIATTK